MLRTLTLSLAASTVLLGVACGAASATPIPPTNFVFGAGTTSVNFAGTGSASFSDMFTLTFLITGDTSIGFSSNYTGLQGNTKYTTFSLSDGVTTYNSLNITNTPNKSSGDIFVSALDAGIWSLTIGGTAVPSKGTFPNYGGTISVTSVPLPATLPMLGAAVLALGAVGFAMKRGEKNQGFIAAA